MKLTFANVHTKYTNILDTIDSKMIIGDENDVVTKGKILIGAANPDLLESYIEEGDIVITETALKVQHLVLK